MNQTELNVNINQNYENNLKDAPAVAMDSSNPDENATKQEETADNRQHTKEPETAHVNDNSEESNETMEVKRKKPKLEIELDFTLQNEYYYKTRERRSVIKYEEKPLSREELQKKKSQIKERKLNSIRDRKKLFKYEEDEEQFVCETCNLPFMTIQALIRHRKMHLKVLKFNCALCSEKFDTNLELIKHKIIHNDEDRNFLCMKCKTAFTDHLAYLKHKLIHQQLQAYKCIECGKEYNTKAGFVIHLETHFDNVVECDICHRKMKPYSLNVHRKTHTSEGYNCVECGKKCLDKKNLDYHMISHTGVKPHQCLYCGKGFSNAGQKKIHTRTHTDERPYECKVCHQKFRQFTDMMRHSSSHETEKKIQCDVCNKKFLHQDTLNIHMDIHNNTQKFKCNICGKRIHTQTGLKDHLIRYHSDEKKFKCVPCGVSFKTNSDILRHNRKKKHINNQFGYNRKMKSEE